MSSGLTAAQDLWDVRRTAQFLGVHEKTIRRMVAAGGLPCVRIGSRLRFLPSDIFRWVSARKEGC